MRIIVLGAYIEVPYFGKLPHRRHCRYHNYRCVEPRYIHGIQMLPVTPALLLSRTTEFCTQETCLQARKTWSFPKIRGIVSGVLTVFGGLCWGPPILGNYQEKGRLWTSGEVLFLEGLQAPIIP